MTNIVSPIISARVAAHRREIDGIDVGQAIEADAEHEGEQRAGPEIAVDEGAQIDDRLRAVSARQKNATAPTAETTTAAVTGSLSNQSFDGPSSSAYSSAPRKPAMASEAEPVEVLQQRTVRLVEIDQQPGRRR